MDDHNSFYPLLDLSQIDMLLDCGDEESFEMFSEILDLFEQESSAKFAELKEAKTSGDALKFGNAAHTLAGSSANIGGRTVWKKAKSMENHCKMGNPEDAYILLDEIGLDLKETMKQLRAYLAQA